MGKGKEQQDENATRIIFESICYRCEQPLSNSSIPRRISKPPVTTSKFSFMERKNGTLLPEKHLPNVLVSSSHMI